MFPVPLLHFKLHADSIKSLLFHFSSIIFCWLILASRFQACYISFQGPFDSLISCFSPFLLEEGSSACIERPPCTSKDFFQIHTPCDKEGKVSQRDDTIFKLIDLIAVFAFENKVVLFRNPFPNYFPNFASSIESEALGLSFACPLCSLFPSVRICQMWVRSRDVLWWDDELLALVMGLMGSLGLLPYFHAAGTQGEVLSQHKLISLVVNSISGIL